MPRIVRIFEQQQCDLASAIDGFLEICRAKNLSSNTTDYYGYRLRAFLRFLEVRGDNLKPEEVTPKVVRDFITKEREDTSATTAHHSLLTLRVFFKHLESEGLIDFNPALKVDKPRRKKHIIPTFSPDQVQSILSTCSKDFYGVRDRLIILLMLDTGLRVQELVTLQLSDVSIERQSMKVTGKGNKERILPFGANVRTAMAVYLARRGKINTQSFFVNHYGEPLTRFAVRSMMIRRGKNASVTGVRLSPHTFRHTFAKYWLINGGDAFSLQQMLGHTSMDMVRNYVNMVAGEVQEIHRSCSPVDRLNGGTVAGPRKRIK